MSLISLYTGALSSAHQPLTLSLLGLKFSGDRFEIFFLFSPENRFLSKETIYMKSQSLLLGEKERKKYIVNLLSAELSQRVVKVIYVIFLILPRC